MKRGNGDGCVTKLSGKRRKPWVARVHIGWTDDGKAIRKNIGTYPTKKQAEKALSDYFYAPEVNIRMTLEQAYNGWKEQFSGSLGTLQGYASAYKKLTRWRAMEIDSMTLDTFQSMVDQGQTYATASAIKKVLSAAIRYAFANDGCKASRLERLEMVKLPERSRTTKRRAFTEDEIQDCFDQHAVGALILIFTGLRREELLTLQEEDFHLDEQYIKVRKSKTANGYRDIPIPDGLLPYVKEYIASGSVGLSRYRFEQSHWQAPCLAHHDRHDCRHTYITILTGDGVDQRIVKMLAGHAGSVTEDVYTHLSLERKLAEVNRVFEPFFKRSKANIEEESGFLLA